MNKPFNVGDKVFDIRKGNGEVVEIDFDWVCVRFPDKLQFSYNEKGFYSISVDKFPSLYHGHDLVVTVKEPEYEWQWIGHDEYGFARLSHRRYATAKECRLCENSLITWTDEVFEPSKRLVK